MAQGLNLAQIERKAWMSYFDDGLLDIYLGVLLLIMGLSDRFLDWLPSRLCGYGVYAALVGAACLGFWAGKRYITIPRLGRVVYGPTRKARRRRTGLILVVQIIAGVVVMGVLLATLARPSLAGIVFARSALLAVAVGVWVMIGLGLVAYGMDFTRGYLIAALYGVSFGGSELLGSAMVFVLAAAVIMAIGLIVLARFLRRYPMRAEGPPTEETPHVAH
jgi:hypothetical protein